MDIYNASVSSVDFCIFNERDDAQLVSLYPGGFGWASISPGTKFSWNHGNREKVRIEFRFSNNKRATYLCVCNPGVTIKPGMDIVPGISVPAQFDLKNEIKHIVVLMLENRSFDNVLGGCTPTRTIDIFITAGCRSKTRTRQSPSCHLIDEANPATCVRPAPESTLLRQVAGWLISFLLGKGPPSFKMRKQYYFRPSERGLLAWDVDRLVRLSKRFPRIHVPLTAIRELDEPFWSD
jgi:hypothetical protein